MLPVVNNVPDPLAELERRQDEALRELDELEAKIELAIREFLAIEHATADRFGRKRKAAA
jgi:hypothetical protein